MQRGEACNHTVTTIMMLFNLNLLPTKRTFKAKVCPGLQVLVQKLLVQQVGINIG